MNTAQIPVFNKPQIPTRNTAQIPPFNKANVSLFRIHRLPTVLEMTGLSRATIYRLVKRGDFPTPRKLSEGITVWNEAEVDSWMKVRLGLPQ